MCDILPDAIYDTPASLFRDKLPDWLADDSSQADVLDAVMAVLAASECEADVKLVLAACREHCTPQPSLTHRLLSAVCECSVTAHKCLIIEQLPHFCTSTTGEVTAAIAACRAEYGRQPALRLPAIAALAAMHVPAGCQAQLGAYIVEALASAPPTDYPTLLHAALRTLPPTHALPVLGALRRLAATLDGGVVGQLVRVVVEVRVAGGGDRAMAWVGAVEAGGGGDVGVLDVLVLVALLTGGEEEEEDAVWRCLCRCVAAKRLTLRRMRDVLSRPWLDVLSSYVPALTALCRRLVSTDDEVLRGWARQLLPGVFIALPASQVEMRRILLSGCSKSYQVGSYTGIPAAVTRSENTDERRSLFNRAEVCADVFVRIAHAAPSALTAHLSYLDSVMDFPDALYPLVLHRLALTIALTIAASPATSSHTNRLCNELTKLLTMGNTAGRKTALIVASHLVRAVGMRGVRGDGHDWVEGLMRRSVAVLTRSLRACVDAVLGSGAGVSMMDLSFGGESMSDGVYVLDGEWNVGCVALDAICAITSLLPQPLLDSVTLNIKRAVIDLAVISFDVPISSPSRPCVLFAHQLPNSLLSLLPEVSSCATTSPSPNVLVHSFYQSLIKRSDLTPLRLSFVPLLFRSHLTCLASSPDSNATAFLRCAYELPAAAAGDSLPADASLLLDIGLCALISYHCCLAAIDVAVGSAPSPTLSRALLTALSTLLHLMDLVLECDKQLTVREQERNEQGSINNVSTPSWESSIHLLHDAADSLPLPDSFFLTTVLHFCLSSPTFADTSTPSPPPSVLRQLYQSAYRPATSTATAGLFTDTGFFSLLHIALRCAQLLLRHQRVDLYFTHASAVFLSARTVTPHQQCALSVLSSTITASVTDSSHASGSTSSSPVVSSSSSFNGPCPWPVLPSPLLSLTARCVSSGYPAHPLEVLLLRDGCMPALFSSLETLCDLERVNRKEPYIAPPPLTKRAKKRALGPAAPAGPTVPGSSVTPPSLTGKEELADEELVTPFQRRKRGRRKQQQPTVEAQDQEVPVTAEEGPAVTVSFLLPDHSSRLMVADCLSLLSTHACHTLTMAITHCQMRQELDERDWPVTCEALIADLLRTSPPTPASTSLASPLCSTTRSHSLFSRVTALALQHTSSNTSLSLWSLAHILRASDGTLPLPSWLLQQLLSAYPHNQLLATAVTLRLLPLPSSVASNSPAASFLSNASIRSPQLAKLSDAAVRALIAHCARHTAQPTASPSGVGWVELTTPLQSSRLTSGLYGDDWTLHWLLWQYCQAADVHHVQSVVEWMMQCMYELLSGQAHDGDVQEDHDIDSSRHRVAPTGHPVLTTLTAASFATYLHLLLLVNMGQVAKVQPSSSAHPSNSFPVASLHRALLTYCHLLQIYLLAAKIAVPPQRQHLALQKQAIVPRTSSTPNAKRGHVPLSSTTYHPLCLSDPSCTVTSAALSVLHSAVSTSCTFVGRLLWIHLPAAMSGAPHSSASSGALHSAELLQCINLSVYASEQAELIDAHPPIIAAPTQTGRKRKNRSAAADSTSSPFSTSVQLLKSVEMLRATVQSLVAPYGQTLQASNPPTTDDTQAGGSALRHSPLTPLPQHTIAELTRAQQASHGTQPVDAGGESTQHDVDTVDEGSADDEDEWSDESDESSEPHASEAGRGVSRFHQRMVDAPGNTSTTRVTHRIDKRQHARSSRDNLFDSSDDESDEEYVIEEDEEEEEAGEEYEGADGEGNALGEAEAEEAELPGNGHKSNAKLQATDSSLSVVGDDDIESGKDEAEED